uniref:Protein FAR1-RELATED SEQUENCE n=1 Tax=Oryza sativa subsp. japonica TaxID=39947 RepID=Q2R7A1_ORYSJ|nr:transposon protein, putative, unclassified, expressed [Oryza sativa Japonica Group]
MFFKEMKVKNNNFYFDIQADEKDAIQNIFWCNASSRAAYHHFGDCITFDTTYRTNMFNMPLAVFVGCNHHMQSVILSVALLRDERAESFEWLFKTFLKCMGGKAPMCILTDEDPAMASAIREVLKNTIHRLCRWHVLKKYKKQLGVLYEMFKHRNFKEKLHFVINHPLTPSEFVAAWKDLVEEFELQGCEVMENLYNLRAEWIPAYFKQIYYARMTSTQRSESVNHMVKTGYLKELTALHRVAAEMNRCIQMRKQKED